jgi:hypothetical protein
MSNYFKWFPTISYNNMSVVDITRRVKIMEDLSRDPYIFLPYTVTHDDRADDIAYYYYGDASKVWLIYLANNIIDPYKQWPLSYDNFQNYIIKKYSKQSNKTGLDVLNWSMNTTITDNILYYKNNADSSMQITPDTFLYNPEIISSEWSPVRVYDYEFQLNEDKRNIWLINSDYVTKAEDLLQATLNG